MQTAISGYHLLMILTNVDGKLNVKEDLVIRDWLARSFPGKVNLDNEIAEISSLAPDEYLLHFHKHMDNFYRHSTERQRLDMLQFAMNLIKADGVISNEENSFFNELYTAWNHEELI